MAFLRARPARARMAWLAGMLAQTGSYNQTATTVAEAAKRVVAGLAGNGTAAPAQAAGSDTFTSTAPAGAVFDIGLGLPPETLFVAGVAALAVSKAFERRHGEVGGTLAILAGLAIHAANVLRSLDDGSPFAVASLGVLVWCAWTFVAYRSARLADLRGGALEPPGPAGASGAPPSIDGGDRPVAAQAAATAADLLALAAPGLAVVAKARPAPTVAVSLTARDGMAGPAGEAQAQEWRRSTWRTSLAVRFACRADASGLGQAADVQGGAFYGLWFSRDRVQAAARVQVERAPGGGWTVSEHGTLERSSGPVRVAIENAVERGGEGDGAWAAVTTRMRAALNAAEGPTLTATVGAVEVSGGLPDASKGIVCAFGTRRWG
jgi:hypothetical protein